MILSKSVAVILLPANLSLIILLSLANKSIAPLALKPLTGVGVGATGTLGAGVIGVGVGTTGVALPPAPGVGAGVTGTVVPIAGATGVVPLPP